MFAIYLEDSAWLGTIGNDVFFVYTALQFGVASSRTQVTQKLATAQKFAQESIFCAVFGLQVL